MSDHLAKSLAKKLAKKFNLADHEVKTAINEHFEEQQAKIWTTKEVAEFAVGQLNLPVNERLVAEAMEKATGGFFKAGGGVNWKPVETALNSVLAETFNAFSVTEKDGALVLTGVANDPDREPNPDEIMEYDSDENAQMALKALWCASSDFTLSWDGQTIADPWEADAFVLEENNGGPRR